MYSILSLRWKIRIGDQIHDSSLDDDNLLLLDIVGSNKHPKYDGLRSYYDVAVLTTGTVQFSEVIQTVEMYTIFGISDLPHQ
jgi:hypothetical protein